MQTAALKLTTKALPPGPNPQTEVYGEPLEFKMEYCKQIGSVSQYEFVFKLPQSNKHKKFNLAGPESFNFFGLMDAVLTPNQPQQHQTQLTTVDQNGATNGTVYVTLQMVYQFANGTRLFSYAFSDNPIGPPDLSFQLTSTDAGSIFSVFDGILWSNPPNPPVY